MKFCRPTFVRAGKVDHELAVKTFKAHASAFHPIARKLIEKVRVSSYGYLSDKADMTLKGSWDCMMKSGYPSLWDTSSRENANVNVAT